MKNNQTARRAKSLAVVSTKIFALTLLTLLGSCANDLEDFIKNNLFGPPYRRQVQVLLPSNGATDESFGASLDIDGSRAIVGAPTADGEKGAAYIFEKNSDGTWDSGVRITALDGIGGDFYGRAVAISGDLAVVGASDWENTNGDEVGKLYFYKKQSDGSWSEIQTADIESLYGSNDSGYNDQLGWSVAMEGSWLVAGARQDNLGSGSESYGAAYVLKFDGEHWDFDERLDNSTDTQGFGFSVDILGNLIAVGAANEDTDAAASDDVKQGAAYIFSYETDDWEYSDRIVASTPTNNAHFGAKLVLRTDHLFVAAPSWEGVAGNVGFFERTGTNEWGLAVQTLVPDESRAMDFFGYGMATDGTYTLVGAPYSDFHSPLSGAVFLYEKISDGTLSLISEVAPEDTSDLHGWGVSIAIDDGVALIGETDMQDPTQGGAVYVFE